MLGWKGRGTERRSNQAEIHGMVHCQGWLRQQKKEKNSVALREKRQTAGDTGVSLGYTRLLVLMKKVTSQ